jgi:DNA-binding transcriptional ArsR family regulator
MGARKRKTRAGPGAPLLQAQVAELRALAHPLRLRILELFAECPRTTKQVADLLGEPPTRLYHHVNALERAGLLLLKETRANRGTVEKWYAADATRASSAARGAGDGPVRGVALTVLDQSRHEIVSALRDRPTGHARPLVVRAVVVGPPNVQALVRQRLSDFLAQLQSEAEALHAEASATSSEPAQRWSMTIGLAPVATPAADAVPAPAARRKRTRG